MDTRVAIEDTTDPVVLSVAFNNDSSCFAVGLDTGFCVFNASSCQLRETRDFNGGLGLVQMMGTSNMIALVGGGRNPKFAPNKLQVWDDLKAKTVVELPPLRNTIRGVQLTRHLIGIAMQNKIQLYTLARRPTLKCSYETANNLMGLIKLTETLLVCPGRTEGHLQVINPLTDAVTIIPAHESSLQCLALSMDGAYVATASERGTLINVFSTSSAAKVAVFRRGADFATIFSLAFSPAGGMLACTSDKSTLHIFDVGKHTGANAAGGLTPDPSGSGYIGYSGSSNASVNTTAAPENGGPSAAKGKEKWGVLSRIPFAPRLFRDEYSFVSAPFEAGDEPLVGGLPLSQSPTLGTSRPVKGVIGWVDEENLVVVGAGKDARWEKFVVVRTGGGVRLVREGWKRYFGGK